MILILSCFFLCVCVAVAVEKLTHVRFGFVLLLLPSVGLNEARLSPMSG